jgi:ABC-type sugar transport system permease subunit
MLPPIIVGGVFRIVLADEGPVNAGLRAAGLGFLAPGWFTDPNFVLITVVVVIGWVTLGSGVLFYSTGLAISRSRGPNLNCRQEWSTFTHE